MDCAASMMCHEIDGAAVSQKKKRNGDEIAYVNVSVPDNRKIECEEIQNENHEKESDEHQNGDQLVRVVLPGLL